MHLEPPSRFEGALRGLDEEGIRLRMRVRFAYFGDSNKQTALTKIHDYLFSVQFTDPEIKRIAYEVYDELTIEAVKKKLTR